MDHAQNSPVWMTFLIMGGVWCSVLVGCPYTGSKAAVHPVVAKAPIRPTNSDREKPKEAQPEESDSMPPSPEASNEGPLQLFYRELDRYESGQRRDPLRILHIGDSHVASDSMTALIRRTFQEEFGAGGRGYIAAGIPWRGYRQEGVDYSMSPEWWAETGRRNETHRGFGIGGTRVTSLGLGATLDRADPTPFHSLSITYLKTRRTGRFSLYLDRDDVPFQTVDTALAPQDLEDLWESHDPEVRRQYERVEPTSLLSLRNGIEKANAQKAAEWQDAHRPTKRSPRVPPYLDEGIRRLGTVEVQLPKGGARRVRLVAIEDRPVVLFGTETSTLASSAGDSSEDTSSVSSVSLKPEGAKAAGQGSSREPVSGELKVPGVVVSSIGLNGAQAETFLNLGRILPVQELEEVVKPDLIVVTLGTNEAYNIRDLEEWTPERSLLEAGRIRSFLQRMQGVSQGNSTPKRSVILMLPMEVAIKPQGRRCYERHRVVRRGRRRWVSVMKRDLDLEKHPECRWTVPASFGWIRQVYDEVSQELGVATWDASIAMGGEGSLHQWALEDPPRAQSDGVHLTSIGYESLSGMFVHDLMEGYRRWSSGGYGGLMTTPPPLDPFISYQSAIIEGETR